MSFWVGFWTVFFFGSLALFAGLAVVVTVGGVLDIRSLFASLTAPDRRNGTLREGTASDRRACSQEESGVLASQCVKMHAPLSAENVKKYAKSCGADVIRIGSMDRWEGAPKQLDARYIFPDAKSIIGFAFRIPRGYLRGIEEGTFFSVYPFMGYAGMNWVYMPIVLREVCCFIEDHGYEAVPIPNYDAFAYGGHADYIAEGAPKPRAVNLAELGAMERSEFFSRAVEEDKPCPDVSNSRCALKRCKKACFWYWLS